MYANRGGACLLPEMFGPMGHEHIHCHAYINIYSTYSYWYGYTLVYACHAVLASTYNSEDESTKLAQPIVPVFHDFREGPTPAARLHRLLGHLQGLITSYFLRVEYILSVYLIYIYIFDVYSEILSHISHTNWHFIWHPT